MSATIDRKRRGSSGDPVGRAPGRRDNPRTCVLWIALFVCVLVLVLTAMASAQTGYDDVGIERGTQNGPIEQARAMWQEWRNVVIWIAAVLLLIVALWIINPFRMYDSINERLLRRSLLSVDDLLKRIQAEAETTSEDAQNSQKEDTVVEEGLLGALTEVSDFTNAEQVPAYVLTVNDLMLDNIRLTLKRLRRFTDGSAERYRDYMYSVLKGIKTQTQQSAEAGVSDGLAVDIRDYFADDKRYQAWRKLLTPAAKRGKHQEIAEGFLLFMRAVKDGRPLAVAQPAEAALPEAGVAAAPAQPAIPKAVNEETLPTLQQAAAREARDFCFLIQNGRPRDDTHAWQFELVRRQQQFHLRDEAQRMLAVFLSHERKALREVTKIRMLPCRTWGHLLHLLGIEKGEQLDKRIRDRLLTTQEILILEKAFLQTFAKRESLAHVYGQGKQADMMLDLHVPQIRRETLAALRQLRQVAPEPLADATQALNEEETPQNGQVKRLIEHYVHQQHNPPATERKRPGTGT